MNVNEKYGAKIFSGEYKAAVIILLNEDNSWDIGYDGGLIECLGLLSAGKADLERQTNKQIDQSE